MDNETAKPKKPLDPKNPEDLVIMKSRAVREAMNAVLSEHKLEIIYRAKSTLIAQGVPESELE